MVPTKYQWLNRAAIIVLAVIALLLTLIAGGLFDPSPSGSLRWELAEQSVSAPPAAREIRWLEEPLPPGRTTIRLAAALADGERDSGYGMVTGDEDGYFAVAVSPLGYVAIWETERRGGMEQDSYLLQWQTWPHVKLDDESNEIWLDIAGNRATVRINREWLWEGTFNSAPQSMGLLAESFGNAAVVDFAELALFAAEEG